MAGSYSPRKCGRGPIPGAPSRWMYAAREGSSRRTLGGLRRGCLLLLALLLGLARHALAVRVLAVLVGAVELLEGLATVGGLELLGVLSLLGLALLRGVRPSRLLLPGVAPGGL